MEGSSILSSGSSYPSSHLQHHYHHHPPKAKPLCLLGFNCKNFKRPLLFLSSLSSSSSFCRSRRRSSPRRPTLACALIIDDEALERSVEEQEAKTPSSSAARVGEMLPKIDKTGRFCSPRAARELALSVLYAACLEGSDPVRLFEKHLNARRESGYEFDKAYLMEYNHMSFGGPAIDVESSEEADELQRLDDEESHIEAEVLSAPPKLVYSKLILRFARKLLVAIAEKWDDDVLAINKVAPPNWKNEAAGKILEFSILHLAMAEIAVLGTQHQIVINEAVDLAKRFCDGGAPRIINGCLRTYLKNLKGSGSAEETKPKHSVIS